MKLFNWLRPDWRQIEQRITKEQAFHEKLVLAHYKLLIGRRAIHYQSGKAGVINGIIFDRYQDVIVCINNSETCGHRHYFHIEGELGPSGILFDKYKHSHFKD